MSEYPMLFEAAFTSARRAGNRPPYKGLIYRLVSPSEEGGLEQAECSHSHLTIDEALLCARSAADSQNVGRAR